jgi:hypothetical protein
MSPAAAASGAMTQCAVTLGHERSFVSRNRPSTRPCSPAASFADQQAGALSPRPWCHGCAPEAVRSAKRAGDSRRGDVSPGARYTLSSNSPRIARRMTGPVTADSKSHVACPGPHWPCDPCVLTACRLTHGDMLAVACGRSMRGRSEPGAGN